MGSRLYSLYPFIQFLTLQEGYGIIPQKLSVENSGLGGRLNLRDARPLNGLRDSVCCAVYLI